MNEKYKTFLKNSGYAIASNLLTMLVSSLVVLILPKIIGVESYGYWQLYLFYSGYVGFLHLGWIDGIYLKYGGANYEKLDKGYFSSQFSSYLVFQLVVSLGIFLLFGILPVSPEKHFIYLMLAWTVLFTNLRFFTIYILQTTSRIKESSQIIILDRLIYFILLLLFVLLRIKDYRVMIYVDVFARFISLLFGIYHCKEVLLTKSKITFASLSDIIDNIKIGSILMLANVASMLIIGIVRLGIERQWDIQTFGKVSLTLSISNLVMIFINAVGVVIYPMLRRVKQEKLPLIYIDVRQMISILMLAILAVYYPLSFFLFYWLPEYRESIQFMVLVFPVALFESKMALLVNTYLKALRMEKYILTTNIITVTISAIITILTTLLLKNLTMSVLSILFLLALRSVISEKILSKKLGLNLNAVIGVELLMVSVFVASGWFLTTPWSVLIYLIAFSIYLYIYRQKVSGFLVRLKKQ